MIAERFTSAREPADVCDAMLGRDSRQGCSEAEQRPRVGVLYYDPYLYRCVGVTVPAHGHANVAFFELGAGRTIHGMLLRDPGLTGNGKRLRWRVLSDGGEAGTNAGDDAMARARAGEGVAVGRRPHAFELTPSDGAIQLRLDNESGRDERVCVAAAEFE